MNLPSTETVREVEGELLSPKEYQEYELRRMLEEIRQRDNEFMEEHIRHMRELRKKRDSLEIELSLPVVGFLVCLIISLICKAAVIILGLAGY